MSEKLKRIESLNDTEARKNVSENENSFAEAGLAEIDEDMGHFHSGYERSLMMFGLDEETEKSLATNLKAAEDAADEYRKKLRFLKNEKDSE